MLYTFNMPKICSSVVAYNNAENAIPWLVKIGEIERSKIKACNINKYDITNNSKGMIRKLIWTIWVIENKMKN